MTLADKLNKYEVWYKTGKEGITLEASPEDDSLFDETGTVTDHDFGDFLDVLEDFKVWVGDHPLDRRAGLVCFVEHDNEVSWHDDVSECCWV